MYMQESKHRRK